jgi:hypothetical protein
MLGMNGIIACAETCYRRALYYRPDSALAHSN